MRGKQAGEAMNSRTEDAMTESARDGFVIAGALVVAAVIAVAGSDGTARVADSPVVAVCIAAAFAIQWLAFLFAWTLKTERFFDLTGSLTFLTLAVLALAASGQPDPRALVVALLVGVWAVRLGAFLSLRIGHDGFDRRFTRIRTRFSTFLMTWTLQGLWVSVSFAAGLAAIAASSRVPADGFLAAGVLLWSLGFTMETTADVQKRRFRSDPDNAGRFIRSGLWAWCRHPNYFGEILLWTGIAVAAWPALTGWAHLTLVSPVFVWALLTRISGVPMLEASADRRWGSDADYAAYRARTPCLVPVPPRWQRKPTAG